MKEGLCLDSGNSTCAQNHHHNMAEGDSTEWDVGDEEPADLGELDHDYSSVEEKIAAGLKEKEKGNALFAKGEYEAAWMKYDRSFVHVYTSKEEWEAIGKKARKDINQFKLPCHLNRGLCRLRKDDLDNAHWDFSEALRIDPENPKGLYRRALVSIGMVRRDMAKQETGEYWDLDAAERKFDDARKDLMNAVNLKPNDLGIRKAFDDLKEVKEQLAQHRKKYHIDQKKLYSKLMSKLDKENQKLTEEEEKAIFADMPRLERVRIE